MEEEKLTLEDLQQGLIDQIGSGDLTDQESEAVRAMFDSVNKAIAEKNKAENERLRIEAENERAAMEAEAQDQRSKRDLQGKAIQSAGSVIGTGISAGFGAWLGYVILKAEGLDILCRSGAWKFLKRP